MEDAFTQHETLGKARELGCECRPRWNLDQLHLNNAVTAGYTYTIFCGEITPYFLKLNIVKKASSKI